MIPNRWVVLWNNQPVGINQGTAQPFKTDDPKLIQYWNEQQDATAYMNMICENHYFGAFLPNLKVVEIQFRIMDK